MRKLLFFSALALVFGAGCSAKSDVVRLAVAVPLTGDIGTEGQGIRRAVELAVEEANALKKFPFKSKSL